MVRPRPGARGGIVLRIGVSRHVLGRHRSPSDYLDGNQGDEITVEFTVVGMHFLGLNGGPRFTFNQAVSFMVHTDSQAETDRCWNAIVCNGGLESQCGWCSGRFGLLCQITPRALLDGLADPDRAAAKRVMDVMMGTKKIDIVAHERALGRFG